MSATASSLSKGGGRKVQRVKDSFNTLAQQRLGAPLTKARTAKLTRREKRSLFIKTAGQVYANTPRNTLRQEFALFCAGIDAGMRLEREACAEIVELIAQQILEQIRARGQS